MSWLNPEIVRNVNPDIRLAPDVHGIVILPDDGNNVFARWRVNAQVQANTGHFARSLEECLPGNDPLRSGSPSIRRAIRVLNLAEINEDPIAKLVLAVSTIEGLAKDPPWSDEQRQLIENAAAWLERAHGDREEAQQVVKAVRQVWKGSIRQRIRKLLKANDLSSVWKDWDRLYERRSGFFHGRSEAGSEHLGSHLEQSRLTRAGAGGDHAVRKNRPLNGTARRGRGSRPCQGAFRSRLACRTEADLRRSTGYSGITIAGVVVTVRDNDTAQVTGVTVDAGDAQLVVNWTAVDNATGYTVQWKSGGQGYNTDDRQATVTPGSTTSHTIPSLTNGTAYTVRVIATRTGATNGPPSAEVTGTPAVPPPPPPVTVTDLEQVLGVGVAPGNAQLMVTWTAVSTATGYTVQWTSGSQGYNTGDRQATVTPGSTTSHTIPSLTNGTAYTVRVIATRTGATDGPPSAEVTGTPEPEPEPVPALPLLGQLLLALGLAGAGAMRLVRSARRP